MSDFTTESTGSTPFDSFKRVAYSQGMVLGADDLEQDQRYFIEQSRLRTRLLHGYGQVCGLKVTVKKGTEVNVSPGVAINPRGELIRVDAAQCGDLRQWLDREYPSGSPASVFVVLCYRECGTGTVSATGATCRTGEEILVHARIQELFEIRFSTKRPPSDEEWMVRGLGQFLSAIRVSPEAREPHLTAAELKKCLKVVAGFVMTQLQAAGIAFTNSSWLAKLLEAYKEIKSEGQRGAPHTLAKILESTGGAGGVPSPLSQALWVQPSELAPLLDEALHLWTTEFQPLLVAGRACAGAATPDDGMDLDDHCVLLAELKPSEQGGGWEADVSSRPHLFSTRLLQEYLLHACSPIAGSGCALTLGEGGDYPTLSEALEALADAQDISLCLLPGAYRIDNPPPEGPRRSLKLTGSGAAATRIEVDTDLKLAAKEVTLRDLAFDVPGAEHSITLAGERVAVEGCVLEKVVREDNHIWSVQMEGASPAQAAMDESGNVFVWRPSQSSADEIIRLDSDGQQVWAINVGSENSVGRGFAMDADGNALVAGIFSGAVDFGGETLTSTGTQDLFIVKLDGNGQRLWSVRFGPPENESGGVESGGLIAADPNGGLVVAGFFEGKMDFGELVLESTGGSPDLFVLRLDSTGGNPQSVRFDAEGEVQVDGLAIDANGNLVIAGDLRGSLDFGEGPIVTGDGEDEYALYVAKLSAEDFSLIWSRKIDGEDAVRCGNLPDSTTGIRHVVAVDPLGDVVVTGDFKKTVLFGDTVHKTANAGAFQDIFVAKLSGEDGRHLWSSAFGNAGLQLHGGAIVTDGAGNLILVAHGEGGSYGAPYRNEVDFGAGEPTSPGVYTSHHPNLLVAAFDPAGRHLWSRSALSVGDGGIVAQALASNPEGSIVIAGTFSSDMAWFGGMELDYTKGTKFVAKLAGLQSPAPLIVVEPPMAESAPEGPASCELSWTRNRVNTRWSSTHLPTQSRIVIGPGDALSLSGGVGGVIRESNIVGYVTLMNELPETLDSQHLPFPAELDAGERLRIVENDLFRLVMKTDAQAEALRAYDSLSITDNKFNFRENGSIARTLTMSGNQFGAVAREGDVVAVAVGRSGVFTANQAEQVTGVVRRCLQHRSEAANLLQFDDSPCGYDHGYGYGYGYEAESIAIGADLL